MEFEPRRFEFVVVNERQTPSSIVSLVVQPLPLFSFVASCLQKHNTLLLVAELVLINLIMLEGPVALRDRAYAFACFSKAI